MCFDEWANNGDHGVMVYYNAATVWEDIGTCGNRGGCLPVSLFEDAQWHSVVVAIDAGNVPVNDGASIMFTMDGDVYGGGGTVASYALPSPTYLGFTGRTGGATNNHWVKAISIGGGAASATGTCVDGVCGTIDIVGTGDQGTTYQLTVTPAEGNIYTIFGDETDDMTLPAGYQEGAPFGTNTGGVAAAFVAVMPSSGVDSWLSVGITDGDAGGALGSVGIDFASWTADAGITVSNGAVFWMSPNDGPTGASVVAQITTDADFSASISAQGRSASGDDWQARNIRFTSGGATGGTTPPPAPPPTPPPPPVVSSPGLILPSQFTTMGACKVDDDDPTVLSVTQVAGGQLGQCYTAVDISSDDTVRFDFEMYCGDGSGADGMCVNLGKNSLDGRVGEDGVGTGVALCFDEWANGGDHGVMMYFNGQTVWVRACCPLSSTC